MGAPWLNFFNRRHMLVYVAQEARTMLKPDAKVQRLRRLKVLNPRPQAVQAPRFHAGGFFDPNDLVQVKYEMLRHAREDGVTKAEAAALFGLSRPTFYQAAAAFEREGLAGLLPRARGPKTPHKVNAEVLSFIEQRQSEGGPLQARALVSLVRAQLGISLHPRTIERCAARIKKR